MFVVAIFAFPRPPSFATALLGVAFRSASRPRDGCPRKPRRWYDGETFTTFTISYTTFDLGPLQRPAHLGARHALATSRHRSSRRTFHNRRRSSLRMRELPVEEYFHRTDRRRKVPPAFEPSTRAPPRRRPPGRPLRSPSRGQPSPREPPVIRGKRRRSASVRLLASEERSRRLAENSPSCESRRRRGQLA